MTEGVTIDNIAWATFYYLIYLKELERISNEFC